MEADNIEIRMEGISTLNLCEEGDIGVLHAHDIIVMLGKEESDDKGIAFIVEDEGCIYGDSDGSSGGDIIRLLFLWILGLLIFF